MRLINLTFGEKNNRLKLTPVIFFFREKEKELKMNLASGIRDLKRINLLL